MFARRLSIQLRPNKFAEFTKTLENQVIPLLRKQPGFRDEITFAGTDNVKILAISLWDTQENATAYEGGAYKDVLKMVEGLITGSPKVGTTEVIHSTFHKIRAGAMAA